MKPFSNDPRFIDTRPPWACFWPLLHQAKGSVVPTFCSEIKSTVRGLFFLSSNARTASRSLSSSAAETSARRWTVAEPSATVGFSR